MIEMLSVRVLFLRKRVWEGSWGGKGQEGEGDKIGNFADMSQYTALILFNIEGL